MRRPLFSCNAPTKDPPTGPLYRLDSDQLRLVARRGKVLGPGKTSQLRILASILAQRLSGFAILNHQFNHKKDDSLRAHRGFWIHLCWVSAVGLALLSSSFPVAAQD